MKEKEIKPDWITDEQWKAVPSIGWWKDVQKKKESIAKQKPMSVEEVKAMFERARNESNWNER